MFFAKSELLDGFVTRKHHESASGMKLSMCSGSTRRTSTALNRSVSPTASASRKSTGRRSATCSPPQIDYSNVGCPWRVPAGLSERIWQIHRPARWSRQSRECRIASGGRRTRQTRSRQERHLSRNAPIASGCGAAFGSSSASRRGDDAVRNGKACSRHGRAERRTGDPLVPVQPEPISGIGPDPDEIRQNHFTYDEDPDGRPLPFRSARATRQSAQY